MLKYRLYEPPLDINYHDSSPRPPTRGSLLNPLIVNSVRDMMHFMHERGILTNSKSFQFPSHDHMFYEAFDNRINKLLRFDTYICNNGDRHGYQFWWKAGPYFYKQKLPSSL